MITALITFLVGLALIIPGILFLIFGEKKKEKLEKQYEAMYQQSRRFGWHSDKDEDRATFDKKYAKVEKLNDFYRKWIGFGWGRKLIYSVLNIISQVAAFAALCVWFVILIKLPMDRVEYAHWDEKVDYFNSLEEPTAEDITRAKRLNTCNYGEDAFIFLSAEEEEHVKTYKVNTDEMYRKFYKRVGVVEDTYDND